MRKFYRRYEVGCDRRCLLCEYAQEDASLDTVVLTTG